MAFPPSFLQELRDRLPLSEVAASKVRLLRAGREFKACCPFHNEKSPSFTINDAKQFYHCFGCGAHGDIIGFVMQLDKLSFPEAIETLAARAGMTVPRDTPLDRERFDREKHLYQLLERATAFFQDQLFTGPGREAMAYLKGRGLSEDTIRGFQLGYAPQDSQALLRVLTADGYKMPDILEVGLAKKAEDRNETYSFFRHRVMFPVGDRRGRTVAFGGRVLGDGEPKYLNSPDHPLFHKGKLLYGLSRARTALAENQPIVIVEGYMDVIALVQTGFTGAVAPLGTALTEDQMSLIWKLLPPLDHRDPSRDYSPILCFDGDTAGKRAAYRAVDRCLPLLTPLQTFRVAFMPEGKDPDDLVREGGRASFDKVLTAALPMIDVLWEMTLTGRRLETPEDRGTFMSALQQKVSRLADQNLRGLYQQEVQKRLSELWRPTPIQGRFSSGSGASNGNRSGNQNFGGSTMRRQPKTAKALRERILLALMINHPALFADFGEEFAQTSFETPHFEGLRQQIVDILAAEQHEPLDATALYRHLSGTVSVETTENRLPQSLKDVLSEQTYTHAAYARPGQPIEGARQGWKSVWNNQVQERLLIDLQAAKQKYTHDASEENLSRLLALRQEVELMLQESTQTNMLEAGALDLGVPSTAQD